MTRGRAQSTPPRLAEWLVTLSLGNCDREAVLGDLSEEFAALDKLEGGRVARRWYWRQVLGSILPNVGRRLAPQASSIAEHGAPPPRAAAAALADSRSSRRLRALRSLHTNEKGRVMNSLWQDLRFGWRMMWRRPLVTAIAMASLAMGIAAVTVVFSLLDAAVLRALPVGDPAPSDAHARTARQRHESQFLVSGFH